MLMTHSGPVLTTAVAAARVADGSSVTLPGLYSLTRQLQPQLCTSALYRLTALAVAAAGTSIGNTTTQLHAAAKHSTAVVNRSIERRQLDHREDSVSSAHRYSHLLG
jgi:hypothetical protein